MVSANVGTRRGASARAIGAAAGLSAINAENQQIAKQTPNFTPKNVKLGVFALFKKNRRAIQNHCLVFLLSVCMGINKHDGHSYVYPFTMLIF